MPLTWEKISTSLVSKYITVLGDSTACVNAAAQVSAGCFWSKMDTEEDQVKQVTQPVLQLLSPCFNSLPQFIYFSLPF
jgi:hypothetical protein